MIDVDYFKNYNDSYGHRAGDQCLKQLAKVFQATAARSSDLACRYGGEEFAILLPNIDAQGTLVVAEKIRTGLEDLAIPHARSPVSEWVTVSLGCATQLQCKSTTWEQLVSRADAALYRAKQGGRNRLDQAAPHS
jgi:diguanylate cyclase (GGDEF)-like protein